MSDPIIKLEGIDFYYDRGKPNEVHALTDINLEIERGEFVSFFGSSGSGKSTMLYVMSGIDQPDVGHVWINGHDLTKFSQKEMAVYRQIGIGLIFQNFNLIPSISVIENIMLPMSFFGVSLAKRKERAIEISKELGMESYMDRLPYELSGGQQQRVGIARALANDPPLILADEPTGNLDSVNAVKTLELLKDLSVKKGKTVVLVTHEAWSLKYVNRVFYMKDGVTVKTETVMPENIPNISEDKGIIEGHYSKADKNSTKFDARAKSFTAIFLRGYSREQMKRGEGFFLKRFSGDITKDELIELLNKAYLKGGLGLWKQKAKKVADAVEEVIREEMEISLVYKKLEKSPYVSIAEEIDYIRRWVLEEYSGGLSVFQIDSLNEVIQDRIENIITADHLRKVLNLSLGKGGIGLSVSTALKVADRLESLITMDELPEFRVQVVKNEEHK